MSKPETAEAENGSNLTGKQRLSDALAWAKPELEPHDTFFLVALGLAYGPRSRQLWPSKKPPTSDQLVVAYKTGLVAMAEGCSEAMAEAGAVPTGWVPDGASLHELWVQYVVWIHTTLSDALNEKWFDSPRLTAIACILKVMRDEGQLPKMINGNLVKGVVNQGHRKARVMELGPNPLKTIKEEDVLSEMVAVDRPSAMIMDRDEHGSPILVPNFAEVFDRMARDRRGEPNVGSLDHQVSGVNEGESRPEIPDTRSGQTPSELAEQSEAARLLRDLAEACRRRGPASEAAYLHVYEGASRRVASDTLGVTPKQIRHAEVWLREQLGAISRALGMA